MWEEAWQQWWKQGLVRKEAQNVCSSNQALILVETWILLRILWVVFFPPKKNWHDRSKFALSKVFLGADYLQGPREDEHLSIGVQFYCSPKGHNWKENLDGDYMDVFVRYSLKIKSKGSGD